MLEMIGLPLSAVVQMKAAAAVPLGDEPRRQGGTGCHKKRERGTTSKRGVREREEKVNARRHVPSPASSIHSSCWLVCTTGIGNR